MDSARDPSKYQGAAARLSSANNAAADLPGSAHHSGSAGDGSCAAVSLVVPPKLSPDVVALSCHPTLPPDAFARLFEEDLGGGERTG